MKRYGHSNHELFLRTQVQEPKTQSHLPITPPSKNHQLQRPPFVFPPFRFLQPFFTVLQPASLYRTHATGGCAVAARPAGCQAPILPAAALMNRYTARVAPWRVQRGNRDNSGMRGRTDDDGIGCFRSEVAVERLAEGIRSRSCYATAVACFAWSDLINLMIWQVSGMINQREFLWNTV